MTNQEAIAYLRPIADSTPLAGYGQALEADLKALEMVEELRQELRDERYRHDRYLDYSRGQDQVIDRLKQELEAEKTYREFYEDLVKKMQERFAGLEPDQDANGTEVNNREQREEPGAGISSASQAL